MEYHQANKEAHQVVIHEGIVYDVREYAPEHPGGDHLILERLGRDITQDFEDSEHTKSARNIMADLPVIGKIIGDGSSTNSDTGKATTAGVSTLYGLTLQSDKKYSFDYDRGLLYQIFTAEFTFEDYVNYINEPKHLVNPIRDVRLFDHWFLEVCSKTSWWVIPVAWAPVIAFCFYHMWILNFSYNPVLILADMGIGMFIWTLTEYCLHRFLFHGEDFWMQAVPFNKWVWTAHFLFHGIHHSFPQDRMRLVMPPSLGYVIGFSDFYLHYVFFPREHSFNIIVGGILGYITYDLMHFFMHHSNPKSGYLKTMKLYHMQHHYKFGTVGFGVSNKLWDHVFATTIDQKQE